MERTEVLDLMGTLKLYGMRSAYDEVMATAIKRQHEPPRIVGDLLSADGAAFHNGAGWWRLRYRCGLTPDHLRVASFQFAVGDAIPRSQWQAHNLPTPDGADPD